MPRSKPNCPHCQNLGLDSKHWLRKNADAGSEITCPVLLATECKYCHKTGHNVSKCSRLLAKKKADATKKNTEKTVHVNIPSNSSYAAALMNVLRNPVTISCSSNIETIHVQVNKPKQKKDIKHSWADDEYWASSDEE